MRTRSQIMADKPVTIRRERVGSGIGSLDEKDLARLHVALAFVMGAGGLIALAPPTATQLLDEAHTGQERPVTRVQ